MGEPWLVATRRSLVELEHIAGFVSEEFGLPLWVVSLDDDTASDARVCRELAEAMSEFMPAAFQREAAKAALSVSIRPGGRASP